SRRIESARVSLLASARQLGQGARRDLDAERRRIDDGAGRVGPRARRALTLEVERTDARARRVHLVDPRRVVERGYAIVRLPAGRVVTDPAEAPRGTRIEAELRGGRVGLISEGRLEEDER